MAAKKKTTNRKTTSKKAAPKKKTPAKRKARASKPTAKKPTSKKVPATAQKPGTTLTRKFKGKTYELKVTADGYALGDVAFRSLTAAAKAVTQYPSISGPRFWLGAGTEKGAK